MVLPGGRTNALTFMLVSLDDETIYILALVIARAVL